MRTATAALTALINAAVQGQRFEWVQADLYTFLDANGSVLARYTSADADLQVNLDGTGGGPTYVSPANGAPLLQRKGVKCGIGTKVEQLQLELMADSSRTLSGVPWLQALRNGALDGGRVLLYRFLSDSWSNTAVGAVNLFAGRVGQVNAIGRSSAEIDVNSDLILLNVQMPRELQQPQCANLLYDVKCALNPVIFAQSGTVVAAGSTRLTLNTSGLTNPAPYFTLGKVQLTSGVNSGVWRTVRLQAATNQLVLVTPLIQLCANGDTFTVYAGCDHTLATCVAKFNNRINFRGAPFTPKPEMVT